MSFDPNATGNSQNGVFSLPYNQEESQLVLLSVPWEVTTSYGDGTSYGPDAVLESSKQLDLCDALYGTFYEKGIYQIPSEPKHIEAGKILKYKARIIRDRLETGEDLREEEQKIQEEINQASDKTNQWVYENSKSIIDQNKFCGVIGGDHSSPFGLIKALKEKYNDISILHVDAHHDLRKAYQGYKYSHASIMYNVMEELEPHSLVQFGIRDFCPEEHEYAKSHKSVFTYYDSEVALNVLENNTSWTQIMTEAFSKLSDHVYISFDIDGLSPDLCPNTGTPVPGGLSFHQMETLLYNLSQCGKKIIGFDLCEVSPQQSDELDGWDGNVGARVLFKLCGALLNQQ
ncbi:MAG: agmatinase family protein [Bdellovibrionales bacterium]|nr:agmatinase family protein [Bdellovibrionales bacterium]NQZ18417.1 agmatinase family protein [Bdellovibrionales bacterium]